LLDAAAVSNYFSGSCVSALVTHVPDEGFPFPFGADLQHGGINFAVFSAHAERIELCVFNHGQETRYALHGPIDNVFHGFLRGASAGLIYGYRAHGKYAPHEGHRFNAKKLLLDPYAKVIVGKHVWSDAHSDQSDVDNADIALKAQVYVTPAHARQLPRTPDADTVLYEVHVKGFTKTMPLIPTSIRGTYSAIAHPASIDHLKRLGVTSLSLLPVHYRLDEPALAARDMTNYWGYNTLGFFCVEPRLSMTPDDTSTANVEFRSMVDTLHANGFEVLLDVVYNHTPEADGSGATLSFRGLDNASWYRLDHGDPSHTENFTGCGNTLNVHHPRVTQFVLDSLRFWVEAMGVDGFRFDLAPVLGRTEQHFHRDAPFFTALRQDPVLARVRLIAEPWDLGPNGYQVGQFPSNFLEWNDKFRDCVRRYWLGGLTTRGELAQRLTASSDLFRHNQRRPTASVNYISVHDGFTLTDMVSYSRKNNHANGENNRDGRDDEPCNNFGIEGTDCDPHIANTRSRVRRAMIATLLLAQGTPMLCSGDEIGNSQSGNNNPYCLDDETTWLNWGHADTAFYAFVADMVSLRKREPLLRRNVWFDVESDENAAQITWFAPNGRVLWMNDWHVPNENAFASLIESRGTDQTKLLLAFNPERRSVTFTIPTEQWRVEIDSSLELKKLARFDSAIEVPSRSVVVLLASR
jgi:isoamylase